MELRPASIEFAPEIFAFLKRNPSENGFENGYEDLNYESFFAYGIASMIAQSKGESLKPGYVPQTHCFLFDGRKVIGYFKVRHCLTRALRGYAGHIGFMIDRDHRGKGYAKIGLSMALDYLRSLPDFDDEYILLDCNKDNLPSFFTQLSCGGVLYKVDDHVAHFLFKGKEEIFLDPPVLSFEPLDESKTAGDKSKLLPGKMIVCFFEEAIEKMKENAQIEPILTLKGENSLTIYHVKGTDVCLMPGRIGGAACAGFAEEAISCGVNRILFLGGCGVLKDIPVGTFLVVKEALRQEGFSYSYLPSGLRAKANKAMMKHMESKLEELGYPYEEVTTWTTDAFYRESTPMIEKMKELGADTVEMEQAGMIALAMYRGIDYGALLYSGDDLSKEEYDKRGWNHRLETRRQMIDVALKILEDLA